MKKIFNSKKEPNQFIYERSKKIFLGIINFEYLIEFNNSILSLDFFSKNKTDNIPICQNNLNSNCRVNIKFSKEGDYELHFTTSAREMAREREMEMEITTKEKQCEIIYFRVFNNFEILKKSYTQNKFEIAICACEIVYQLEQLSYHIYKNYKNGENFALFLNEKCKQIIYHCKISSLMLKYPMKKIDSETIDLLKYSLLENLDFIDNLAHHQLYSSLSKIIEKIPEKNYRFECERNHKAIAEQKI
jgi:hypothetical protein